MLSCSDFHGVFFRQHQTTRFPLRLGRLGEIGGHFVSNIQGLRQNSSAQQLSLDKQSVATRHNRKHHSHTNVFGHQGPDLGLCFVCFALCRPRCSIPRDAVYQVWNGPAETLSLIPLLLADLVYAPVKQMRRAWAGGLHMALVKALAFFGMRRIAQSAQFPIAEYLELQCF